MPKDLYPRAQPGRLKHDPQQEEELAEEEAELADEGTAGKVES